MGAVILAYAALLGIVARDRHGVGQHIEVSQLGSQLILQALAINGYLLAEHADGDLLLIGTHYAEPCSGRLVADGQGGHRFEASPR